VDLCCPVLLFPGRAQLLQRTEVQAAAAERATSSWEVLGVEVQAMGDGALCMGDGALCKDCYATAENWQLLRLEKPA